MSKYASKIVAQAISWLGSKESDGSHEKIIDTYNAHKPLARGYPVKYTDQWCATFVSAVAVAVGYTDIIPTECSCPKMIDLFKRLGCWVEDEAVTPMPGWILFYDWQDNGSGDNRGSAEHVGIVEKVSGRTITVIEGNYSNSVKRRTLSVNGRYIRGYGVPKYDAEEKTAEPTYSLVQFVMDVQAVTGSEVDGIAGTETIGNTPTVSEYINRKHPVVVPIQKRLSALGYTQVGEPDGVAGPKFSAAVLAFQKDNQCWQDGEITAKNKTWRKLLEMG